MAGLANVIYWMWTPVDNLYLRWRASGDVRNGRFRKDVLRHTVDGREAVESVISSPFSVREAQRYQSRRQKFLSEKKFFFRIVSKKLVMRISRATFAEVCSSYREIIGNLEIDINMENMRASDKLENLAREKEIFDRNGQSHMSQLCINKAEKVRSDYYDRNGAKYQSLNQMITLLMKQYEVREAELLQIRARVLNRLSYYYFCASNKDNTLGHYDMTPEKLELLMDLRVMEEYREIREVLARKLEKIASDIAELNSWRR